MAENKVPHANTNEALDDQAKRNKAMNDWIQSRISARRITVTAKKQVDPLTSLRGEVRELRRDLARANGTEEPDTLEDEQTMDDMIRAALKRPNTVRRP